MNTELMVRDTYDASASTIASLREEIRTLRRALGDAEAHVKRANDQHGRALANLKRQLSPLYRALQDVFGELHDVSENAEAIAPAHISAVWDSWKSKMPGRPAQIIDALLLHGSMNSTQLAIAIGIHRNNVPGLIFRLNKAGLIDKNGHNYSLKSL